MAQNENRNDAEENDEYIREFNFLLRFALGALHNHKKKKQNDDSNVLYPPFSAEK